MRRYFFGTAPDDRLIDQLLLGLRQAGGAGMTRTQIRRLLGSGGGGAVISRALSILEQQGRTKKTQPKRPRRFPEIWTAV
jgi:hypothetical protein